MAIYITGDCHGDWSRFNKNIFYEQENMTRDDYVIVAGDFGLWNGGLRENMALDALAEKPFTILFIDGNHENFDRLLGDEFKEIDWHGGKAKIIRENVLYLERGYVFDINGNSFFAFGGAASYDIKDGIVDLNGHSRHEAGEDKSTYYHYVDMNFKNKKEMLYNVRYNRDIGHVVRINKVSWWKEEMPNEQEMMRGLTSLEAVNNTVDFIITHCAPQEIVSVMYHGNTASDPATRYLNQIAHTVKFKKWFFGHYHDNKQLLSKFILLYEQIIQVA